MKKTYVAPKIRTTIPPQMALDIDKPCSFIAPSNTMSMRLQHKLAAMLDILGAEELDDHVVDAVYEKARKKKPAYALMPPKDPEALAVFNRIIQGWDQL